MGRPAPTSWWDGCFLLHKWATCLMHYLGFINAVALLQNKKNNFNFFWALPTARLVCNGFGFFYGSTDYSTFKLLSVNQPSLFRLHHVCLSSVEHVLPCPKEGLPSSQHYKLNGYPTYEAYSQECSVCHYVGIHAVSNFSYGFCKIVIFCFPRSQ